MTRIKESNGKTTGRGMAIAGLILGYGLLGLALAVVLTPYPVMNTAIGERSRTLSNGKQIFTAMFAEALERTTNAPGKAWPSPEEFPTSTAFFTNMVGRGLLKVDYSFFAAPGIPACHSTNAALFEAGNNAWCVVADLKVTDPDDIPLLFTRNLHISSLAEFKGGEQVRDEPPFGRKAVVIVFKGGATLIFKPDSLASNFNCSGATNRVLRP